MDVFEAINKRRSIRSYRPDDIPEEIISRLLEAIRLAPSSGNRQPYRIIVVRDKETRAALAKVLTYVPGREQGHAYAADAPLVLVACGFEKEAITRHYRQGINHLTYSQTIAHINRDPDSIYFNMMQLNVAIAMDYVDLVATPYGLGTCWIASLDELAVKKLLDIPEDARVITAMTIGYAAGDWPAPRPRKPLDKLVCYEKYR